MRFFKHIAVVAAVLPLALAQYSTPPPPDSAPECSSGEHRCANNTLQVCGKDIAWQTVKECSKTAYCFAQNTAEGGGDCYPLVGGNKMQCSTIRKSPLRHQQPPRVWRPWLLVYCQELHPDCLLLRSIHCQRQRRLSSSHHRQQQPVFYHRQPSMQPKHTSDLRRSWILDGFKELYADRLLLRSRHY
jgi:hypothetical protein